ncbi:hypothetical protein NMG60_11022225 [Bertholletia excelsa]
MADGWDLNAVVRGCTTAVDTTTVTNDSQVSSPEDPLPNLASLIFENDDPPLYYPAFADKATSVQFQGLEEIYRSLNDKPVPVNPGTSSIPILGGIGNQQLSQLTPPQQLLTPPQFKSPRAGSSIGLPSLTVRSRRRKNQQTKLVKQMTQEELLSDSWAWRKYGQKPIKGSPYPRNYYRCSTSKGCAARKQVEKSPSDPSIYVVSYTGEHTHPRPTHRNSLAGSTRNKLASTAPKPESGDCSMALPPSSSPISASSFSSTALSMDGEDSPHETDQTEDIEREGAEDDVEDLLIPNTIMSEDILKGFQELGGGFSGGAAGGSN